MDDIVKDCSIIPPRFPVRQQWRYHIIYRHECYVMSKIFHLRVDVLKAWRRICASVNWAIMRSIGSYNSFVACSAPSYFLNQFRADSRSAPSQWETALLCNDVSHWRGASLESAQPIADLLSTEAVETNFGKFWMKIHELSRKCFSNVVYKMAVILIRPKSTYYLSVKVCISDVGVLRNMLIYWGYDDRVFGW